MEFALFILLQEGTTLCGEKAALAPGIAGVYGQVPEDVFSSLTSPANYVFVDSLKRPPMNDTAVSGPPARVSLRQAINRIRTRRRITRETAKAEVAVPQLW